MTSTGQIWKAKHFWGRGKYLPLNASHLDTFYQTGCWKQLRKPRLKLEPRIMQADAVRI